MFALKAFRYTNIYVLHRVETLKITKKNLFEEKKDFLKNVNY